MGYHKTIICSVVLAICAFAYVPQTLQAAFFRSTLYEYTHDIIAPGYAPAATGTAPILAGLRVTYDIASRAFGHDIRIVDDKNNLVQTVTTEHPKSTQWINATIIDRYRGEGKDIVVIDIGSDSSRHSSISMDINESIGEGTVSVFSTPDYYGIELSPWDVLGRDIAVYKNVDTSKGNFTNTTVDYPESKNRYVMVVLKSSDEDLFTIGRVYKKNPDYADSREQFYSEANIFERNKQTVISIDTKSATIQHNRIDMTIYNESLMTTATIETSTDNNHWSDRGSDTLYHFLEGKKEISKAWLSYGKTTDRFIKITIATTGLVTHKLMLISGPAQYLTFYYDLNRRYALFYGNQYAKAQPALTDLVVPTAEASDTATSTEATDTEVLATATTSPESFFKYGSELKIGIRRENPAYVAFNSPTGGFAQADIDINDLVKDARDYPYSETIIVSFVALCVIAGIFKILKL